MKIRINVQGQSVIVQLEDSEGLSGERDLVGMKGTAMITEKEYRALRHANHGWFTDLAEFQRGIGSATISSLVERGLLEEGSEKEWGTSGFRTTTEGKAAIKERFDKYGEVWKD